MNAEIIGVGTELLLGQIVNTNAQFLSVQLSKLGIDVYYQTVVGDNPFRLKEAIDIAFKRADAVIFTGGLGPTKDDLTKETVAEAMGHELVPDEESLKRMEAYFKRMNRQMPESNKKQALMPKDGIILPNHNGTAPGCIMEKDGKVAVLLPGPPHEMEAMFTESVVSYFREKTQEGIYSKVLRIFGIGESAAEQKILHLIEGQTNPTIAPYAKEGEVTIRISAKAESEEKANALMEPVLKEMYEIFGDCLYGEGDEETLCGSVCRMLMERKMTVSCAESCTGGRIAGEITSVPGASDIFKEGVITYSEDAKKKYLSVLDETLNMHGVVSEQVAEEMARGMRSRAGSDLAISVTGVAGPGGGTEEKPVGLVYVGLADKGSTWVKELRLSGNRERVRTVATLHAFDMVRRYLLYKEMGK